MADPTAVTASAREEPAKRIGPFPGCVGSSGHARIVARRLAARGAYGLPCAFAVVLVDEPLDVVVPEFPGVVPAQNSSTVCPACVAAFVRLRNATASMFLPLPFAR